MAFKVAATPAIFVSFKGQRVVFVLKHHHNVVSLQPRLSPWACRAQTSMEHRVNSSNIGVTKQACPRTSVPSIHQRKVRLLIIMRNCGIVDADKGDSVEAAEPSSGPIRP